MINIREYLAQRSITKGTTGWEKVKTKLEKAMDVLMNIVSKKQEKIEKMELESNLLMDKIRTTGNFITNTDKLYADPTDVQAETITETEI